jgi:hypothetical protein
MFRGLTVTLTCPTAGTHKSMCYQEAHMAVGTNSYVDIVIRHLLAVELSTRNDGRAKG